MTKFAAYDPRAIYAVADSAEAAIAKARDDAHDPKAQFEAARIADHLAAEIERDGWDGMSRSFDVLGGWIAFGSADDLVLCESSDGWSLHAPGATDEAVADGSAPALLSGEGEPTAADYECAFELWFRPKEA